MKIRIYDIDAHGAETYRDECELMEPRYTHNGTTCGPENENLPAGLTLRPLAGENRNRIAWIRDSRADAAAEAEARAARICRLLAADDERIARAAP